MESSAPRNNGSLPDELAWLIPKLAEGLSLLTEDDHLLIELAGTNRYVQFAVFGPNLRAETTGNSYLSAHDQLDAGQLTWLADHGWNEPDEGGNHWRHWEPADPLAAATVTVVTLNQVHGVDDPRHLLFRSADPGPIAMILGRTDEQS